MDSHSLSQVDGHEFFGLTDPVVQRMIGVRLDGLSIYAQLTVRRPWR